MSRQTRTRSVQERSFQALATALAVVPIVAGIAGIAFGPVLGPDTPTSAVPVASEYRFLSVVYVAFGLQMAWALRRPRDRTSVVRASLLVIVVGGLARTLSLLIDGNPGGLLLTALLIEVVGAPLLLTWHLRLYPLRAADVASPRPT